MNQVLSEATVMAKHTDRFGNFLVRAGRYKKAYVDSDGSIRVIIHKLPNGKIDTMNYDNRVEAGEDWRFM